MELLFRLVHLFLGFLLIGKDGRGVSLFLSVISSSFSACSWAVFERHGCSTILICKPLRICQVITAAFSKFHAVDTGGSYFAVIIPSHQIQLRWPIYWRLYINVTGAVAGFLSWYPSNRANLSSPVIVLAAVRCALCFILWIWNALCSGALSS